MIMSVLTPHAHWALRLAVFSVFTYHGVEKLGDLGGFAEMTELPIAVALLVALAEAGGGLLVLLGGFLKDWMTRLGALMTMPVMLGAIFMVHWGQWSFMATETHPMGGMEFQVTLLLILAYLAVKGNEVGHMGAGGSASVAGREESDRAPSAL
jgi:putative oxidoreductase